MNNLRGSTSHQMYVFFKPEICCRLKLRFFGFFLIKENSFLCLSSSFFVKFLGSLLKKEGHFFLHYVILGKISASQKLLFLLCYRGKAWEIIKTLFRQTRKIFISSWDARIPHNWQTVAQSFPLGAILSWALKRRQWVVGADPWV